MTIRTVALPEIRIYFCAVAKSLQPVTQAAVDQNSTKAVTDTTLKTYSDDYTFEQLPTIPADQLEAAVNDLFAQQATMILGAPL